MRPLFSASGGIQTTWRVEVEPPCRDAKGVEGIRGRGIRRGYSPPQPTRESGGKLPSVIWGGTPAADDLGRFVRNLMRFRAFQSILKAALKWEIPIL